MNEPTVDKKTLARIRTLREKRQQLTALEPKDAMERILQDPQATALVHSFPEQDFYVLIHDIGPEDAGLGDVTHGGREDAHGRMLRRGAVGPHGRFTFPASVHGDLFCACVARLLRDRPRGVSQGIGGHQVGRGGGENG